MKDLPNWKRSLGKFPSLKSRKRPVSEMPKTFSGGGTAYASGEGVPPIPDTIPPGTVTDLVVIFSGEGGPASNIEFTRPGDDGFGGANTIEFQMRYSTDGAIMVEADWEASTLWPTLAEWTNTPGLVGFVIQIPLTGIDSLPDVDTWIAIRFRDPAGNVGGISFNPSASSQIVIT